MLAVIPAGTAVSAPAKAGTAASPPSKHASAKPAQMPAPKPAQKSDVAAASHHKQAKAGRTKHHPDAPDSPPKPQLTGELGTLQQAIALARKGKISDARALAKSVGDPVAQKLVEWAILRNGDSEAGFDRYAAFIRANPDWPGGALRRRAETRLWQERRDGTTIRGFLDGQPASAPGRFALARALMGEGDRAEAERQVRAAWRTDELSAELETAVLEAFPGVLTRDDHVARMDRRIGRKDFGAAMRAAHRLGDDAVAIVKACTSAEANAKSAGKLLAEVPSAARGDAGYALCKAHDLLRRDELAAAAEVMLAVPTEALPRQDTDEWWRERRVLARRLLDAGDAQAAYRVVRAAALPDNPYYRAEFRFMAGWIALRFLGDPETALAHFAHVDDGSTNPIVLARAAYWRGRAQEAAGLTDEMRASYAAAASHPTAYYGQLARARLGLGELELRQPPAPVSGGGAEVAHAAELLYAIGERELVLSFLTDLAERSGDACGLAAAAEVAQRNGDARTVFLVGKEALARGLPLEVYAFPDIGVPHFSPIGPGLARSIVFSVVRTESEFNQKDTSPAKAVGLMQVTPEAGRDTAKRFSVGYDWKRLVSDPVYNTQMGAAELAALLQEYRGNYAMSFAGYNAGRGRVKEWVAHYGDPRDAKVDAVDWVERIPFSETRNYVQRVMENVLVYRVRFGEGAPVAIEPDRAAKSAREAAAR
jgi:soluble lytic murein transglycosylase